MRFNTELRTARRRCAPTSGIAPRVVSALAWEQACRRSRPRHLLRTTSRSADRDSSFLEQTGTLRQVAGRLLGCRNTRVGGAAALRRGGPRDVATSVATAGGAGRGVAAHNAKSSALQGLPMRRRGLEPPPGYPGPGPQPGNSTVISVRCVPDRPYRPGARTIWTHRTIWMLPRAGTAGCAWRTAEPCGRSARARRAPSGARYSTTAGIVCPMPTPT